ncbi:bifunctional phosphopantothenoylcysteine decarboxylase/phosphopantothenate--cysteine ligase CoaBC [Candidatus Poriferisodalis multihospitum]|uniref:bifunctional phosphopantothenoylcysteine decarboxylase/phosphopantothenate--cysteine ligase CoaBC n=1 Tax=Candidatus Poriferisodalis multihospitum TaxID=2983191 RepID=UPI002B25A7E1|nr:bifunctional phosphopantothenoylcysteine decarboxylase/phosphopantothenate--cysteine ligase CoaBC [Candidatus Poriferisodalis multihospitum]
MPDAAASPFAGRRVVLGVSGGIAAYKAVILCRLMVDAGAHVAPVMTAAAQRFVGHATFDALASERVQTSIFGEDDPIPHTTLGQTADVVVVAPATARVIGSYAAGISDGLLTATLLATRAPVVVCPAMHTEMWEHAAVQHNIEVLTGRGVHMVVPEAGRLAGGDIGAGRLAEPATIFEAVAEVLAELPEPDPARQSPPPRRDFAGVSVTVSAGGTREAIDPVRFIGNRSSGKQGYAIATAARDRGAEVTLVTSAPLEPPEGVREVRVESAAEMEAAVASHAGADVIIMAAAVADFRPADVAPQKIKKGNPADSTEAPVIVLEHTHDILAGLGAAKPLGQVLVGFAAETADVLDNAAAKLARKNLDVMVANDVSAAGAGFAHDTNIVTILLADGTVRPLPICSKREVADAVLDTVAELRR